MSNRFSSLPLQSKVALSLLVTITAFTVVSYFILRSVITPAFSNLELSAAHTDVVRAEQAIQADIENLEAITADWAFWDDIYEYVSGRNPAFKKSNLERPTLTNLDLDLLAVYAHGSEHLWSQLLVDGEEQAVADLGILGVDDPSHPLLTSHAGARDRTVGIVATRLGPMIVSSRPILRSDDTGPVAGALVMAQFLDEARLARLKERTEVVMSWAPYTGATSDRYTADGPGEVKIESNRTVLSSYKLLDDIFGEPVVELNVQTPRSITALGQQSVTAAMLFLVSAGASALVVTWFLLRTTILRPIESLAQHIQKIRDSGDLSHQVEVATSDEIGALATQFNELTSAVHEARKALLFQSFKAGKADTAAEVLHNIRNAMTPMINGTERLAKAFRVTNDLRVAEATGQLRDPECPPERVAKIADYVDASFRHIDAVCVEATEDLEIVMAQAKQVEGILATQEKFANVAPVEEDIVVDEVVGEAAHVIPKDKQSSLDMDLDRGLAAIRVRAHRIGLLQVLGNLILNAYESIERAKRERGRIRLSAIETVVDDRPMVRLTVQDNGTGFDDETGTNLFQRGFSSKSRGETTGLGLHWCANAVAGMGGRIVAESAGSGHGAEFHVLLPAAQGG